MQLRNCLATIFVIALTSGGSAAQGTEKDPPLAPALPLDLPGKGLAQHPFLYCGEWQQRGKKANHLRRP
jgi:hypothetical protein